MNNKILVATIGFDERPVIRAILRHGLNFREILLLKPREPSDPRSNRVIENIRSLLEKTDANVKLSVVEVDVKDFYHGVGEVKNHLAEKTREYGGEILLLLGGGMRSLITETLVAAIQLSNELLIKGIIEIDLEGEAGYTSARIEDLVPLTLTPQERRILEEIRKEPKSLSSLKTSLDLPKTTIWKILQRLEEKGLVEKEYRGRTTYYKISKRAHQYLY